MDEVTTPSPSLRNILEVGEEGGEDANRIGTSSGTTTGSQAKGGQEKTPRRIEDGLLKGGKRRIP